MKTVEVKVYEFDDLSETAQEKAREWFLGCVSEESFWSDIVLEDAAEIGRLLGISFEERNKVPCIYWSGFSSQGDGACFVGRWAFDGKAAKAIRQHAPTDKELHRIADGLAAYCEGALLSASIKHRDRYCHAQTMQIEVYDQEGNYASLEAQNGIEELLRDFANWIYEALEREYDYRTSDAQLDADIRANDYGFTVDGKRSIVL